MLKKKEKKKRSFLLPYPQSTFEALFVKTVNGRDYLKELVDALFIVEVSKLLKGLLDLLPKSLRLMGMTGGKGEKNGKDISED